MKTLQLKATYLCKWGLYDPSVRNPEDTIRVSHARNRWCQHPTPPLPGMVVRNSHTCTNIGPKIRRTVPHLWDRAVSNQWCALSDLRVSLPICRLCAQLALLKRGEKVGQNCILGNWGKHCTMMRFWQFCYHCCKKLTNLNQFQQAIA